MLTGFPAGYLLTYRYSVNHLLCHTKEKQDVERQFSLFLSECTLSDSLLCKLLFSYIAEDIACSGFF